MFSQSIGIEMFFFKYSICRIQSLQMLVEERNSELKDLVEQIHNLTLEK